MKRPTSFSKATQYPFASVLALIGIIHALHKPRKLHEKFTKHELVRKMLQDTVYNAHTRTRDAARKASPQKRIQQRAPLPKNIT